MSDDGTWLETESSVEKATGPVASALLDAIGEALAKAPPEKRYDVEVEVTEHE